MEAGVLTWDASGDRGTPMRELREERGLKVCRRGMSAGLGIAKSLLIVWEQCVRGVVDVRGAWILSRWKLATEEKQPRSPFSRGTKQSKSDCGRVNNDAEEPLVSGRGAGDAESALQEPAPGSWASTPYILRTSMFVALEARRL
ncbi:hypothetical protein PCH_Pc12g01570 [Penicillium rubens Wisconsin 54-1255]|uniref:Uncharacterized protein n=1 Tax=Penicillium rubens (strain ATCC 28089 / DSM 1075 / NRRL 1951 / Wisconsin 54-1255) TaxID=500485 RepID=B6GZ30_PENRW|nr:hypothetical protein PCH_Pc12g01570 [Penicillium rubens Wisconsin 54-1255]